MWGDRAGSKALDTLNHTLGIAMKELAKAEGGSDGDDSVALYRKILGVF